MEYKVEYSYMRNGKRVTEHDTSYAYRAQDAVDDVRRWYANLDGFRIETVYRDSGTCWDITEAWE